MCVGVSVYMYQRVGNVSSVIGATAANVIRTFDDSILEEQVMRTYIYKQQQQQQWAATTATTMKITT